ncbi:MAG: FAD:protein FMN transferase [Galactobacter sp.]
MPEPAVWAFDAIGTRWNIHTPEPLPQAHRAAVSAVIEDYDKTFSRFRPDSKVSQMAWDAGSWELPAYASDLLGLYKLVSAVTEGAVNPLVGASLTHLGYGPDVTLEALPGTLPAPAFKDVCEINGRVLSTSEPIALDVGALGKGQLADLVLTCLKDAGYGDVAVDAGGDVACTGSARRLGVEDPADPTRVLAAVTLTDGALCGSSTRRRAWQRAGGTEDLHHVLDARTGRPVRGVTAAYASAPDAMTADAATTALFFASPNTVSDALGVEALVLYDDGTAAWSVTRGWKPGIREWEVWA